MSNRLDQETSPYLLQHAENPVDWYPWGAEAIDRARAEDRPILLSIGYSSCHWCHVMEHESFEDPSTAALMNRLFVNIKVDREERPDIDQVYMKAVQAMTGGGGWPMTVFLTPDLVPFFGGTYFPPIPRHGLPSFAQVLQATANAFEVRREQVEEGAAKLAEALARAASGGGGHEVDSEVLDGVYRALENRYDAVHGGFGQAPKFPQSVTIDVLLRHHVREPESDALGMAVHTLRRMAAGGLRDHLAGGFHRYSVDARWLVPHFEKMLYDNALLARCYLDAYRVSGHDDLRAVAVETLDYLVADMRSPEGGFFSARDADSEGEEGTFYVWSADEVSALLGEEEGRLFSRVYDVTQEGNFEGKNILHLPHEIEAIASAEGMSEGELRMRLASARSTLLEARSGREPPFRDEKVLASWNGMAIRAFAEAGAALGRQDYVDVATQSAEFLWNVLRGEGRLLHTHMDGESRINAFLDDHASLGNAFLSLHAATLENRWLAAARWLCDQILERFWDETEGTVYDTAADAENLFMRPRDPMDNATPSGASLTAELFTRAGHIFDDDRLRDVAGRIIDHEADALQRYGPAFGRMLSVLDRRLTPPVEVVIAAERGDETATSMVRAAHGGFHPNLTVVGRWEEDDGPTPALLENRAPLDGRAAAYVCRAYSCRLPVTDVDAMLAELGAIQ